MAVVNISGFGKNRELLGIFVDVGCHVRPLVGFSCLSPGSCKSSERHDFRIQAARISSLQRVAGIVGPLVKESSDNVIRDLRLDEGTIGGDANDRFRTGTFGCVVVAIEDICFLAAEARHREPLALFDDEVIRGLGRGCDYHFPAELGAAHPMHYSGQHCVSSQILHYLSWKASTAHAGLNDGNDSHKHFALGGRNIVQKVSLIFGIEEGRQ